jgi:hypothetical protein
MADVYENAHLTIAATWSTDSNTGLFPSTPNQYQAHKLERSRLHVRKPPPRFPINMEEQVFWQQNGWGKAWPLLQRAWVYQERRLSPRILHYGEHQIRWECQSALLAEDGTVAEVDSHHDSVQHTTDMMKFKSSPSSPKHAWRKIVEEYSFLNLTYETDRLAAVAAVVKREMQIRPADVYIAGMWKSSLLEDLPWCRLKTPHYSRSSLCVPTWSWASVIGPSGWSDGALLPALQLEDVSFTPVGPAHLGQVSNASIRLRGPVLTAKFFDMPENFDNVNDNELAEYLELLADSPHAQHFEVRNILPDYDYTRGERLVLPGQLVTIVCIFCEPEQPVCGGIILREITETTFERIGMIDLQHRDWLPPSHTTPEVHEAQLETTKQLIASMHTWSMTIV